MAQAVAQRSWLQELIRAGKVELGSFGKNSIPSRSNQGLGSDDASSKKRLREGNLLCAIQKDQGGVISFFPA
jgi:hypothetical protein